MMFLILSLFVNTSQASENWFCKEASSVRRDDSIEACGTAQSDDHNKAKALAFDNAKSEFNRVCGASSDCAGHEVSVNPKRTSCDQKDGVFTCYRLLEFVISPGKDSKVITPYDTETSSALPKLTKGMSKKDVLAAFGEPTSVHVDGDTMLLIYNNEDFCEGILGCGIELEHAKVVAYFSIKQQYTNDLK